MTTTELVEMRNHLYTYIVPLSKRCFIEGASGAGKNGWKRLYHCTAWRKTWESRIWLMSYQTLVAVYDVDENRLYVFGKYSMTTYQHIAKFRAMLRIMFPYTYNIENEKNLMVEDWFQFYYS